MSTSPVTRQTPTSQPLAPETPGAAAPNQAIAPAAPAPSVSSADAFRQGGIAQVAGPQPAAGRSIPSQVKDKLVSLLWDEISKERSFDLAKLPLGPNGALGLRASERILKPGDPEVTKDPQRSAYEQSPAGAGPHVWLQTGGVIDGNLGLSVPVSVGAATGSIGFNAGASLQFSMLSPYGASVDGAVDLAARHTIDLPVTAENARALPRGSEMMLKGQGQVGSSASLGAGVSWSEGPVTVGASAKVQGSVSVSGEITVNVKRLDGDRVFVRLGEAAAAREQAGASVNVGVSVDHQAVDALVDRGLDTILAGEVRDFLGKKVEDQVNSQMDKLLQKYASAGASMFKSLGQQSRALDAYVIDLSTPEGREAYGGLMRLDRGPAERLAASGEGSVAHYQERSSSDRFSAGAHVGPVTLFDFLSERKERDGQLQSAAGNASVKQSTYDRSFEWLFGGKKQVSWEGVRSEVNGDSKTYLHVAYSHRIKSTDRKDLGRVDRAMKALKVDVQHLDLHPEKDGDVGDTRTTLDAYLTPDAVRRLAQVPRPEIEAAYARAVQQVEGLGRLPAWGDPATATEARQMMKDYNRARLGGSGEDQREQQISNEYSRQFGRWIIDDMEDLDQAEDLGKKVQKLGGKPEQEWARALTDVGREMKYDVFRTLVAMNDLVGADEVLVDRLAVQGKRIDLQARSEGRVDNEADALIGKMLSPP